MADGRGKATSTVSHFFFRRISTASFFRQDLTAELFAAPPRNTRHARRDRDPPCRKIRNEHTHETRTPCARALSLTLMRARRRIARARAIEAEREVGLVCGNTNGKHAVRSRERLLHCAPRAACPRRDDE